MSSLRAERPCSVQRKIILWESLLRLDAHLSGDHTAIQGGVTQGDDPTVIALGLVLERWWGSTLVVTALVWPPQPDGS
jgi:hypothetical protein